MVVVVVCVLGGGGHQLFWHLSGWGVEKISTGTGRDHKNFGDSMKMYPIPAPTPISNDSSLKLLYVKNKYHTNLRKWARSGN